MTIVLRNVSKVFHVQGRRKVVLDRASVTFPSNRSVGLLGRNGAGKTTLLKMLAGTINVSTGEILTDGEISYPVGFAGSFHGDLTGAQNVRFTARIYGVDTESLIDYVQDFAELGPSFHLPFRTYSSGMRSRLAFGVSMGIPFDTYLIDEVTAVGDTAFKRKSTQVFQDRMAKASAVFVTHSTGQLRELCDAGVVLERGRLTYYDDVEEAITQHERNMGA